MPPLAEFRIMDGTVFRATRGTRKLRAADQVHGDGNWPFT